MNSEVDSLPVSLGLTVPSRHHLYEIVLQDSPMDTTSNTHTNCNNESAQNRGTCRQSQDEQSLNTTRRQARTTWSSDPVTCRTPIDSHRVYTIQIYTIPPVWKNMTVHKRTLIGGAIGPPPATQTAATQITRIHRPTSAWTSSILRDI